MRYYLSSASVNVQYEGQVNMGQSRSRSLIAETAFDHVDHRQFVVLPHSVDDRVVLVEYTFSVEFVLLECTLVPLSVLKILGAFAVKHSVVPVALVLSVTAFPVQHPPSGLNPVSELTLVPTAVRPPESTPTVTFSTLELALIHVAFLACPGVDASALLLVEPELAHVVVSRCEVQLTLTLELTVVEIAVDDFVGVFEETHAAAVRSVDFGLSEVDYFVVFEEFWSVEGRFSTKNQRRAIFDNEQFFELQFDGSELATDEASFVVEVVQVKLSLFQHFFLAVLINFKLATHSSDEKVEGFVHFFNRFEPASFDLFERILCEKHRFSISVKLILFTDVAFYDCAVTLVEICQNFQQFFIRLINSANQI